MWNASADTSVLLGQESYHRRPICSGRGVPPASDMFGSGCTTGVRSVRVGVYHRRPIWPGRGCTTGVRSVRVGVYHRRPFCSGRGVPPTSDLPGPGVYHRRPICPGRGCTTGVRSVRVGVYHRRPIWPGRGCTTGVRSVRVGVYHRCPIYSGRGCTTGVRSVRTGTVSQNLPILVENNTQQSNFKFSSQISGVTFHSQSKKKKKYDSTNLYIINPNKKR